MLIKYICQLTYAAFLSVILLPVEAGTSAGCTSEELAVHNGLSESQKADIYGFEGSGIPCSTEMKAFVNEWQIMNRSAAKQKGRERFNENKYGMFIHWGLYSSLGGIYKGEKIEEGRGKGPSIGEWIMRRKEIPRAEYAALAKDFNPHKFNAEQWVAIAKASGMKYIVMGAKHHEGFAMFDSDVDDFNLVDATSFGRDAIKEMEIASKKAGIDFGVYYSNSLDWRAGGDGGMKDYGPAAGIKPRRAAMPNTWDPAKVKFDDFIQNKSIPQVKELLANYDLSQIWFDTPIYIPAKHSMAFYKTVFDANPEILVNARIGNGFGDIGTPGDNVIPDEASSNTWEGIATTNHTWGFKSYDTDWKAPIELLYWLVSNVSKGGNFLLNVGPDGDGVIPEESANILKEVGAWLSVNGEAIYGSKPWKIDREGPTQLSMKGTKHRENNKVAFDFKSNDFWFTTKKNKIYVISLTKPKNNEILVASLKDQDIQSIRVLGQQGAVKWKESSNGINIQLPKIESQSIGYTLEITL